MPSQSEPPTGSRYFTPPGRSSQSGCRFTRCAGALGIAPSLSDQTKNTLPQAWIRTPTVGAEADEMVERIEVSAGKRERLGLELRPVVRVAAAADLHDEVEDPARRRVREQLVDRVRARDAVADDPQRFPHTSANVASVMPSCFDRGAHARVGERGELGRALARVAGLRDERRIGLARMAHQLRNVVALRKPVEQIQQLLDADLSVVLELAREMIGRVHSASTETIALLVRVDARRRPGLECELADRPLERGMVVHPVMRVEVRRLPSE